MDPTATPVDGEKLDCPDAAWRACNDLAAGMICTGTHQTGQTSCYNTGQYVCLYNPH